ncbi:MAG TPA: archaemetzincin [Chitinophagales bacterium]|nr:archaemetzincin [Chitinophagales bacterium]
MVIAIQPIGNVQADRIEIARQALDSAYHARIIILPSIAPPQETFINIKVPRYRAYKLIAYLKDIKPDTVDYIMGLTGYDVSITKTDMFGRIKEPQSLYEDFGIFGLGYKPGKSCIVSYYRLGADATKAKTRLAKICVHELGHNFGLDHCPNKKCVMADAVEKISTIDNAEVRLCERCRE